MIESFYKKYGDKYYLWSNMKIGGTYIYKEWATKDAINRKILYGHVPKYLNLDTIPSHILNSIYQDLRSSIKTRNLNDVVINHDCRLQRLNNGKFYLCIPVDREQVVNKQEDIKDYNVCSIDPGIRTFLTAYSPKTDEIIEYGNEEILDKLKIRFNIINSLKSKLSRHLDTHG